MLTDACFKEGLSATLKPETSLIGHFENDNNNDNHNIIMIIIIIIIIILVIIIITTIISDTSKDLRKNQS